MSNYPPLSRATWIVTGLLIPLVISAVMLRVLERPAKPTDRAADIERELRKNPPEILVIGSSVAGRDIQPDLLAKRMGVSPKKLTVITLPNSAGAHWYAVLKNRVYANGYKPDIIMTVSALGSLATNGTMNAASEERLINQLGPDEPVIGKKIFGLEGPDAFDSYYRRERASSLRDNGIETLRNAVVWLRHTNRRRSIEEGGRRADAANDVVFADDKMDYTLHQRGTPGLAVDDVVGVVGPDYVDPKTSSIIPEFVQLARKHDAKVVFVRVPFPPSNPFEDYIPDEVERQTLQLLEKLKVGYLDMRTLNLDDSAFEDPVHLSPQGAKRFTEALVNGLKAMSVRKKKANLFVQRPVRPIDVRRDGIFPDLGTVADAVADGRCGFTKTLPDLPPLSDSELDGTASPFVLKSKRALDRGPVDPGACSGQVAFTAGTVRFSPPKKTTPEDLSLQLSVKAPVVSDEGRAAWWVYPGTTLRFLFDKRDRFPADRIPIFAVARAMTEGEGVPTLTVGDSTLQFQRSGDEWRLTAMPPTPSGAWSVSVTVPEGGSYLLIDRLVFGQALTTSYIVGEQEELGEASVRLIGGYQDQTGVTPTWANDPVAVPGNRKPERYKRNIAMLRVPEARDMADGESLDQGKIDRCSPFIITENGTPLPLPHSDYNDIVTLGSGRSTHLKGAVYFTGSDSSDPTTNGRRYQMRLDPERRCPRRDNHNGPPLRDGIWLYPGDTLRIEVPPEGLSRLYDGIGRVVVEGMPFLDPERTAVITARLEVDGAEVLQVSAPTSELWRPAKEWVLDTPALSTTGKVVLELANTSEGSFVLLTQAYLAERDAVLEEASDTLPPDLDLTGPPLKPRSMTRTGSPTAKVGWSGRRKLDDGTIRGSLPKLTQVSNTFLAGLGLGPWSPLVLTEDGEPMRSVSGVEELAGCTGCFVHKGSTAVFSRTSEDSEVSASLTSDFPLVDADGNRILWIYPGTTLQVEVTPPSSGSHTVAVSGRSLVATRGRPMLRVGEAEAELSEGGTATVKVDLDGPTTLEILSPPDGPFVLLTGLWLGKTNLSPLMEPPPLPVAVEEGAP